MNFINNYYNTGSGIITIQVPQFGGGFKAVQGILQNDLQVQMGNNWNPLSELNSQVMDKLQGLQQVWQADSVTNYIPTSGMAWKGTAHIKVHATFYLISHSRHANIQADAKTLAELCALKPDGVTSTGFHGGYKMNLYDNNLNLNNSIDLKNNNVPGTCEVIIDSHTRICGLLAQNMNYQTSTVCVKTGKPLYYIVDMSFTGYRAPIISDLNSIFGGR